jgi:hypothetical protein
MLRIATEHAGEAADTLRRAALLDDPYLRADAVWEAVLRLESAAHHLRGHGAKICTDIARHLEEGCEKDVEAPAGDTLRGYADKLEGI